jgi:regulator of protease activity HflC (stomatin/prohibitin superfamily)
MSVGTIVVLALLAFIGTTIFKGVRIVPQGYKWIVQRLGKYHTTLNPGTLLFLISMKWHIKLQLKILC